MPDTPTTPQPQPAPIPVTIVDTEAVAKDGIKIGTVRVALAWLFSQPAGVISNHLILAALAGGTFAVFYYWMPSHTTQVILSRQADVTRREKEKEDADARVDRIIKYNNAAHEKSAAARTDEVNAFKGVCKEMQDRHEKDMLRQEKLLERIYIGKSKAAPPSGPD